MPDLVPIRRALVSVSDKTDLVPFVKALTELGVEIVSTGGTARALSEAGIDVIAIDSVTGFPEMMDGRVKTLHPAIHGAVLARRDVASHVQAMDDHGITPIDLVCINLYPFEQTVRRPDVTTAEAIEQIDIGGPALLRSSAKNHESVTVVTSTSQYDRVVNDLKANDGATTFSLRRDLAAAAFMRTAEYDTNISAWMCEHREEAFPSLLRMSYAHQSDLRYGENPHQRAAIYTNPASSEPGIAGAELLHGKPLSYNNIADGCAALALVQDLAATSPDRAAATVIKHTNPCGAAVREALADAFDAAHAGDPLAAFGGVLAVSRTIDDDTAERIADGERFFEVIVAPGYSEAALERLGRRWKNVRLLALNTIEASGAPAMTYRSIPGGMLVQERDQRLPNTREWTHAAGPAPTDEMLATAAFAWSVAKHLTSNAVAVAAGASLLGAGAGQMDRVASCRLAVEKAGARIGEASSPVVAASDAFFPFADGPQVLADAGIQCLVHPGGSKRDEETFELCNERDVTCLLTGIRHFRH